jgi:hypothetical protein
MSAILIEIEGPCEQEFLVHLARKDNLHGVNRAELTHGWRFQYRIDYRITRSNEW